MAYYDVNGVLQEGDINPYLAQRHNEWDTAVKKKQGAAQRGKMWRTAASGAALFGGAVAAPWIASALSGAGGGAGAVSLPAAATEGMGFSAAPLATTAAKTAIPWMQVGSKAVDTLGGIYASRKQSQANDRALSASERANAQAMQIEREQMDEARRQFDIQQTAAKEQWAAMQKFEADKWAASEEERLYDRRLRDEREARLAPRRALAANALQRIPGILASGRTSPGLGSLGSFRRS